VNVTVLTWMRNEVDMAPFFLRHYAFADRIIAWDNESTDGTRDVLRSDPRVEVRDWVTGGVMDDTELTRMKNEEYRKTGPGWKMVVDADEFLWHPDIRGLLAKYDDEGVTMPRVEGFDMVSQSMPEDDGLSQITEFEKIGCPNTLYNKFCVFRECVDVAYWHGAHRLMSTRWAVFSEKTELKLLHYRYMSIDRTARKAMEYKQSPGNVAGEMGLDNCNVEMQLERWRSRWESRVRVI
jgi:hypothetical protein